MTLATVQTIMKIRYNFERECLNVLPMLIKNRALLRKISNNLKYEEAKLKEGNRLVNIMEYYEQDTIDTQYESFWQQDFDDEESNSSHDPDYEDFFFNDSSEDEVNDSEEVPQSELDYLMANVTRIDVETSEAGISESNPRETLPTALDCLEYEHNYTEPEVDSPWHITW